ncbi:MAG: hypothetical protein KDE31_24635 [Caldilineaceae bacterium]|nr:hypothetical protein [Caldilineaceae bacterium]
MYFSFMLMFGFGVGIQSMLHKKGYGNSAHSWRSTLMLIGGGIADWLLAGLLDTRYFFPICTLVCGVIAYRMASKLKPLK